MSFLMNVSNKYTVNNQRSQIASKVQLNQQEKRNYQLFKYVYT